MRKNYTGKNVLVVGLGTLGGGVSTAIYFASKGANVTVTDLKSKNELEQSIKKLTAHNICYTLQKHKEKDFIKADLIIRNPAVSINFPLLNKAREKNIPVHTAESFLVTNSPTKKIIGITGTRGKSTTSALVYNGLKTQKQSVFLGGNMKGTATLDTLNTCKSGSYIVLELSSWQLASFREHRVSPWISLITNIYPDHLNYYASMDDYIDDKKNIYLYQKQNDHILLNKDNKYTDIFEKSIKSTLHYFSSTDWDKKKKLRLFGKHNIENAAAAMKILHLAGVGEKISEQAICSYKGLPGRLEIVGKIRGVTFVNDTTSTTPTAGIMALKAFPKGKIILLTGGNSKHLPASRFIKEIRDRTKSILLFNGNANKPFNDFDNIIDKLEIGNIKEALEISLRHAKAGDIILFSPGFTHLPYINEFTRGDLFDHEVQALAAKENKKRNKTA